MTDELFGELEARHKQILDALGTDVFVITSGAPGPGIGLFRQDSNFHYLTGFPEQGAVAVFDPTQDSERVLLFVKEKDRQDEVWQGFTIGVKQARATFPVDGVHNVQSLRSTLEERLKGRTVFYKSVHNHPQNSVLGKLLEQEGTEVRDSGPPFETLLDMRIIKSAWEVEQTRRAIAISTDGHHACMRAVGRHGFEYQLEAEFEYACKLQGVRHFAFGAIVAAGAHATCQHYVENNGPIADDDLVLIDAGARWNMYCADITRTFPASGTFSPVQRDLYEIVLASQKAGVEAVAPELTFHELNNIAAHVLIDGLKELGILHGNTDEIIDKNAYRDFWPGGLAHSVGLDVHDSTPKGFSGPDAERKLEPGMVITVEPGFYSQDFNHQIPETFKHIGIRVEDNVLVTENGHENLTAAVVKELADVEQMVSSGR
ncbi:MAG: aminopeptidase P family protein [Lentisphaerae bacterium]|jgi:Xaa-Pro aminopeptidase|nr:aminopeptidase P family protein [Lentisphaerota bacterium]MBT4820369.1 aminopeptidase P family protein [Lentisphaerota bacterium]MBT5605284.1 aminopeptidase P family protein [Lentisphaerota bacterium]MBT7057731.1 aminopeptidase P family protein [Lentisphaerota bacterium]MBT7844618.1 aminopeptidase P family protein [Lentisphaerota bacterium]